MVCRAGRKSPKTNKTLNTTTPDDVYTLLPEVWTEAECEKRASHRPTRMFPRPGMIGGVIDVRLDYGIVKKPVGGFIHDGAVYGGVLKPLPVIPASFEIVEVAGWGYFIQRKTNG